MPPFASPLTSFEASRVAPWRARLTRFSPPAHHGCAWARALLVAAMMAAVALGSSGCSSDGGDADPGVSVWPLLDMARRASALIGPEGGSIEAMAADGTEYRLEIPPDALVEEREIALTPLLALDGLPMSGGLIAGVHFEPSGLELLLDATLMVIPASVASFGAGEVLAGFSYDGGDAGDGERLALALAEGDGGAFTLPIAHFSGGGGGAAEPAALEAAFAPGTPDAFIAQLLAALDESDAAAAEAILQSWYAARVRPALQAAVASDAALERALGEYRRWLNAEGGNSLPVDVGAQVLEARGLAAAALGDAIDRAQDRCERQASFVAAEEVLLWQRRAEAVLPEDVLVAHGLDGRSVLADLCVQVVFESTSFPLAPIVGESALLEAVVGFAFGEEATEFSPGMPVFALAIGADPAGSSEVSDDLGRVDMTLTPSGGSVEIELDACIGGAVGAGALTRAFVCQEALIVRGLVVSPAEVTLAPRSSQRFTAQLVGVDEPVTWSATGGAIDAGGLFTADDTSGSFLVTATSLADASRVASARVTIDGDPMEEVTTTWLGTARCFDIDRFSDFKSSGIAVIQTGAQLEIHFPRTDPGTGDRPFGTPCVSDRWTFIATLSGGAFSGSSSDCSTSVGTPCTINGSIDGGTISGQVVWQSDCECFTDFEATVTDACVALESGLDPLRMSCN